MAAWVDFNQNGSFETNEYTFIGTGNGSTINNVIDIPDNIPVGLAKLRVRVNYNTSVASIDYCSTITNGETADYLVNIQPAIPCSGTPEAGTTVASAAAICPLDSVVLTVNNSTTGVANSGYQWKSSHDNVTWFNIVAGINTWHG